MGRGAIARFPGVVPRQSSIKIWFMYQEKRRWHSLKLDPTPANLKYASKLREEVINKIAYGVFDYQDYFPESGAAKKELKEEHGPTFEEYSSKWMTANSHLATSTLKDYRKRLNYYVLPIIGNRPIKSIPYGDLAELLGSVEWGSMKTRNNTCTVIRQPFEMAFLDGVIPTNPAARIKNLKVQKEPPDPFSITEIEKIIEAMKTDCEMYANLFEFAFFTGLRTSELLALCWSDIDWGMGIARISRAKVDGETKGTKTAQVRDIELNSRAIQALVRQKKHSFLMDEEVFINPNTRIAISRDCVLHRYWDRMIRRIGIRYRNPYQTRHTFATLNLMAGANPMWVSRQLGHTSMKMLLEVYTRWIDLADRSREKNKLELMLNVPNTCQAEKKAS
jgi:integrase